MEPKLSFLISSNSRPRAGVLIALIAIAAISACTPAPRVSTINDPGEAQNRRIHKLNKALDRSVLKPLSGAYDKVTHGPVSTGISNFASNLSLPGMVANDLLQLKLPDAFVNTARFTMNTTFGLGGLFDVASQNGLAEHSTDFGETLHVWGVPEGAYVELPVLGPSTERDTLGTIVDFAMDPLKGVLTGPRKLLPPAAHVLKTLGDREMYASTIDSVLYKSEDSYAQTRLLYLQSRRHKLYGTISDAQLEDPYAN